MLKQSAGLVIAAALGGLVGVAATRLLHDAAVPDGAIVAFSSHCPDGWEEFQAAAGRVLMGAGHGKALLPRKAGEIGGSDQLSLRDWPNKPRETEGIIIPDDPAPGSIQTYADLTPFLVVKYCELQNNP